MTFPNWVFVAAALIPLCFLVSTYEFEDVEAIAARFRKATRKECDTLATNTFGALDPEDALHLALQWRLKVCALSIGFAAVVLVCITIIIVNQPQPGAAVGPAGGNFDTKTSSRSNQFFNSSLTTNVNAAPK